MTYAAAETGIPIPRGPSSPTRQERHPLMSPENSKQMKLAAHRVDKWGQCIGILLACFVLGLLAQAAMQRDISAFGRGLYARLLPPEQQLTPLQQQLMGCRTFKNEEIPFVDETASLKVLDTYTPEQRQTAEQFTAAVAACTNFTCLQRANKLPRAPGQFRYPHFYILGFPKCATTSLYCHLIQHPQVQYPRHKEPHTLNQQCSAPKMECSPEVQREYVTETLNLGEAAASMFTRAAFDGSTHYAAEGHYMAERLKATFPWVKVVISMRDPISQALAMHLHNLSHNRTDVCWEESGKRIYPCIAQDLEDATRARYGPRVAKWMEYFNANQLMLVQYESVIAKGPSMAEDLQELKGFLGFDLHLPSDSLPLTNWKHNRGGPDALGRYWNMTRSEYQHLVGLARRNAQEVITLMETNGRAEKQQRANWLRNWEAVWKMNLEDNCEAGPDGNCKIVVS